MDEKWKPCGSCDTKKKFAARLRQNCVPNQHTRAFSRAASLAAAKHSCDSFGRIGRPDWRPATPNVNVHRYEEHIAGRTYLIEVRPITESRWRAQIARLPGMPTALMPFYGPTPEEAARELSRWLWLVYNGCTTQ